MWRDGIEVPATAMAPVMMPLGGIPLLSVGLEKQMKLIQFPIVINDENSDDYE